MLCLAVHCWLLFSIDRPSVLQGLALCWRSRGGAGIGLTVCRGLFPCFFSVTYNGRLSVSSSTFWNQILEYFLSSLLLLAACTSACSSARRPHDLGNTRHGAPCEELRVCNAIRPRFVAAFAFTVLSASSPHMPLRRKECLNLVQKSTSGLKSL